MRKLEREIAKVRSYCSCDSGCAKCATKEIRLKKYAAANIPSFYWSMKFSEYTGHPIVKEKVSRVINDIDSFYDSGKSINLIGGLGTGKTSLSCSIAKVALVKGYSCHYTNMKDIANKLSVSSKDFSDYISHLQTRDFLIIDEVDGRWVLQSERSEKFFGSTIEHLLRSRYLEQLPTIVCSNSVNIGDIFGDDFKDSLSSLFSKYAETIIVAGKDKRRQ